VSVPGTVTLTVHPFSPIVARSDVYTVLSGTTTKLLPFITANDSGSINGLGPITIVTAPSHGYLVQEDGVLTYRAGNDFTGTDTFTYTVSDPFYSDIVSNPATVTLTVVDSMPVYAAEDDVLVFTNEPIELTPRLFFNDRFESGNPPGPINVLTQPVYGTLSESNGTLIYTPNQDFNGVDSFIYTVADSGDPTIVSLPTLVTLTVTDAITASNDFYYASPGETIEFDPFFTYNDINRTGHALTDPEFGPTRGGTITKIGSKYYYTPPPNFTGFDSFYYTVADSEDPTHSASALVQVVAVDANGNFLR
jgi:large repetitive protein